MSGLRAHVITVHVRKGGLRSRVIKISSGNLKYWLQISDKTV